MKDSLYLSIFFCLYTISAAGQMEIVWKHNFGGSNDDIATDVRQTSDGGYIVAGYSKSNDEDVGGNHGNWDYWVLKLDENGNSIWQNNLGGSNEDILVSIRQMMDGGYIAAGSSDSNDGDVSTNNGDDDFWIAKLSENGNLLWQKNYGGSLNDGARSIQQLSDGDYIVVGRATSSDGDVNENFGTGDYWLINIDENGGLNAQQSYGGSGEENPRRIMPLTGGGYAITGNTNSGDGSLNGNNGGSDYWMIKLDENGDYVWNHHFGGSGTDWAESVYQTAAGDYLMVGVSGSNDGDVSNNHGGLDFWIVQFNEEGQINWEQSFGGSGADWAISVFAAADGTYIAAGHSSSNDGHVGGNHGGKDYWMINFDETGNLIWEQSFGGSGADELRSAQQTNDGGYILAGWSDSSDGDVGGNFGGRDYWIVKLRPCMVYATVVDTVVCPGIPVPLADTLQTYAGCDSIVQYNAIELPPADAGSDFTVCEPAAQLDAFLFGDFVMGRWIGQNTELEFQDSTNPVTMVDQLLPGENILYWTLSHPSCPDYSQDEVTVFYEAGPVGATDDQYYPMAGDTLIANITVNDIFDDLSEIEISIVSEENGGIGVLELDANGRFRFFIDEVPNVEFRSFRYRMQHLTCPGLSDEAEVFFDFTANSMETDETEPPSTVFTPNNDGVNDVFIIPELEETPDEFPNNSLVVINRWGDVVYFAKPYLNDWDGTHYQTGQILPAGTYFYVAKLHLAEGIIRRERVTLIR